MKISGLGLREVVGRVKWQWFAGAMAVILVCLAVTSRTIASSQPSSDSSDFWVEEVVSGLEAPASITWLPDGSALIVDRVTGLRRLQDGKLDAKPVPGVPPAYADRWNGWRDVVLDPDFSSNRRLYLLIAEGDFEKRHSSVYTARYVDGALVDAKRIYRSREEIGGNGNSAGRMILRSDGTLLVAVTENHFYQPYAQRLDSTIGKIVRINRDGSIPADNPFVGKPGVFPEIWTYGNRVPTGIFEDRTRKVIYEVEPGPHGGDEFNILEAGANYGWAKASWGFEYNGAPISPLQSGAGIKDPLLVWTPSVTPSGLTRYDGDRYPMWKGDFFVGNLSGRALQRLRFVNGVATQRETMLLDLEERIRDVATGPDGFIYLLTDGPDGRLLRLRAGKPHGAGDHVARKHVAPPPGAEVDLALSSADIGKGKMLFQHKCAACHSVGKTIVGGNVGPDLESAYGRPIGTKTGFNYSAAMASYSQTKWNRGMLELFLIYPEKFIPGTTMSAPPVNDSMERMQLIAFLKAESEKHTP